jgi:hypothetical protein
MVEAKAKTKVEYLKSPWRQPDKGKSLWQAAVKVEVKWILTIPTNGRETKSNIGQQQQKVKLTLGN